jgi:hypothetical protein
MNMFVGSVAVAAGAAVLPNQPTAAKAIAPDAAPAGQKSRDVGKPSLADLIDRFAVAKAAAEVACTVLSDAEEKYRGEDGKLARTAAPRVCGGMTERTSITVGDKETNIIESRKWFFSTREEIEKEGTPEQLADWDRQAQALERAIPKQLRVAERKHDRAMNNWSIAEQRLTRYKPKSMAEAVELLTLAGKPQERGTLYMDIDEWAFQRLVGNCAAALREALAH